MSHEEGCRELLALANELKEKIEAEREARSARVLACIYEFVSTHNHFIVGGYHAIDHHLKRTGIHTSFLLYVNRDKYMSDEVRAKAYKGHQLVNVSHQQRTDEYLAGRLHAFMRRTLGEVTGRRLSDEDYIMNVWNMTVTLRIMSHSIPNELSSIGTNNGISGSNISTLRVRFADLIWLKIWILQQLSLSYYAHLWPELYPLAQDLFRVKPRKMPEHHYEQEFSYSLDGCVVAGTGAICEYARTLGRELPDIGRGITLIAPSAMMFDAAVNEMARHGDVKIRPGMENLFLRKAYVIGRGLHGQSRDFRSSGHDTITITVYDCSHSCLNSYLGVNKSTRYAGYYTVLMYLYYDLLTATHYSRDPMSIDRCQYMIDMAARLRAKFLAKTSLVGHEPECGLFRVFDTECTGIDTTKNILFRREKWSNPRLDWFR